MDFPIVDLCLVKARTARGDIDGHALAHAVVVEEVALDDLALVAEGHEELLESLRRVRLHDVPQDGALSDVYHRLRSELGLLGQARAEASGQDHNLHAATSLPMGSVFCLWLATVAEYPTAHQKRNVTEKSDHTSLVSVIGISTRPPTAATTGSALATQRPWATHNHSPPTH